MSISGTFQNEIFSTEKLSWLLPHQEISRLDMQFSELQSLKILLKPKKLDGTIDGDLSGQESNFGV